jgi:release factor glutamine methyltransferase
MLASSTAGASVVAATELLEEAGCETPRLDAELLVAEALGVDRAALAVRPETELDSQAARDVRRLLRRRARREPVAYILGRRGFRRLELLVDRRVLVPRPETEHLVEAGLEAPEGARVCDVGTGSGAVALALKDERPDLEVSATDVSEEALEVARANAGELGLDVLFELGALPSGPQDLVLANLPYVREDEWSELSPEITRFEPRGALVSGPDGLDAIRALVATVPPGTPLALEHGGGQGPAVRMLLDGAETRLDLAGHERVTVGRAPATR